MKLKTQPLPPQPSNFAFLRSFVGVIAGSFLLRAAAGATGENIQFYFNAIHQAALDPSHPLRAVVGAGHIYPISYTLGGMIIAAFFASEFIGALILGAMSDRFGRRWFMLLGPLIGAIAVQITALTTVIWLLILTRLLEGLSTASNTPATLGYIAESTFTTPRLRSRIVGFFEIATIGGIALGFSLGGWLWREFGNPVRLAGIPLTSPAFALNAVVYLTSWFIFWFGLKEIHERRSGSPAAVSLGDQLKYYWKIVSNPRVAGFAPAWIAINGVLGIWINLSARILTDKTGVGSQLLVGRFDSFQTGNIRAAYAVLFAVGILSWSLLFPGVKKMTAMLVSAAGLFVSCLLLFAINHQPSLGSPLVLPLAILFGISIMVQSGFTPAALAHLANITEDHAADRGAIMGLYSMFLGLGQLTGALIGGPFVDWLGADGLILGTLLLGAIATLALIRLAALETRPDQR